MINMKLLIEQTLILFVLRVCMTSEFDLVDGLSLFSSVVLDKTYT